MELKKQRNSATFPVRCGYAQKVCLFVVLNAECAQTLLTIPPDCAIINLQTTRGNVDKNSRLILLKLRTRCRLDAKVEISGTRLFYFAKSNLKGGNQYENPDERIQHCNEEEKEPQGLLPRRTDRRSGHHGNSGRGSDSVFDWLY